MGPIEITFASALLCGVVLGLWLYMPHKKDHDWMFGLGIFFAYVTAIAFAYAIWKAVTS